MRSSYFVHSQTFPHDGIGMSRQGRDCELSRRVTARVLFPRDGRPGAWLLLLAAVCSFVAVRALELGPF
jgi:hypothetical protein